jgi:hypothetical protein
MHEYEHIGHEARERIERRRREAGAERIIRRARAGQRPGGRALARAIGSLIPGRQAARLRARA